MRRLRAWRDAFTLLDVGELVARWLEGKIEETPWYPAPAAEETAELVSTLARLNRLGLVTTQSQPGRRLDKSGCAQRAAVEAMASETIARRVAALTLYTPLIVFPFKPGDAGGRMVPITLDEFHPFTWMGSHSEYDDLAETKESLNVFAFAACAAAWTVVVIDPVWGRKRYMWDALERAVSSTEPLAARFDITPAESLDLDDDLVT